MKRIILLCLFFVMSAEVFAAQRITQGKVASVDLSAITNSTSALGLTANNTNYIQNSSAPTSGYETFMVSSASILDFYGATATWINANGNVYVSSMGIGGGVIPLFPFHVRDGQGISGQIVGYFDSASATPDSLIRLNASGGPQIKDLISYTISGTTQTYMGVQSKIGEPSRFSIAVGNFGEVITVPIKSGFVSVGNSLIPVYQLDVVGGGHFSSSLTVTENVWASTVQVSGDIVSTNTVSMGTGAASGPFSVSTTVFNSQPYYWPGTVAANNCLQLGSDGKTLSWASCGGVGSTNVQVYFDTGNLAAGLYLYESTADARMNALTRDTTTVKNFAAGYTSTSDVRMAGFSTQNSTTDARVDQVGLDTGNLKSNFYSYTSTADSRMTTIGLNTGTVASNLYAYESTADLRMAQIGTDTGTLKTNTLTYESTADVVIAALVGDTNSISADVMNLTYYLHSETTGTNSAYQLLLSSPSNLAEITRTQNVTLAAGLVKISSHVTRDIEPQVRKLPAGLWTSVTWASVGSVVGTTQLVVTIATASYDLATVTEILSATSPAITSISPERFDLVSVQQNDILVSTSDRILVQYYARTTLGLGTNVSIYFAGTARPSHVDTSVGSVYKFIQLVDAPPTLIGSQGKYLTVNNDQTALVFVSSITDSFNSYTSTADTRMNAIRLSTQNLTVVGGNTNYIFNQSSLQPNSVFYVSSGTVSGPFVVVSSMAVMDVITSTSGFIGASSTFTSISVSTINAGADGVFITTFQFVGRSKVVVKNITAASTSDSGILFVGSLATAAVFTEFNGLSADVGINATAIATRDTTRAGGFFRLNTRNSTESSAFGTHTAFTIRRFATGSNTAFAGFTVDLDSGTTALCQEGGKVGVATTTPRAMLSITSGSVTEMFFTVEQNTTTIMEVGGASVTINKPVNMNDLVFIGTATLASVLGTSVSVQNVQAATATFYNVNVTSMYFQTPLSLTPVEPQIGPAFELLADTLVPTAISSMTVLFSTRSSIYIVIVASNNTSTTGGDLSVQFNGDTAGNLYSFSRSSVGATGSLSMVSSAPAACVGIFGGQGSTDSLRIVTITVDTRGNFITKIGRFEGAAGSSVGAAPISVTGSVYYEKSSTVLNQITVFLAGVGQASAFGNQLAPGSFIRVYGQGTQ